MSTTPQFEIPTDMRKITEKSVEQVKTAITGYLHLFQSAVPGEVTGGAELSSKVLRYAERDVANAFEFAQRLVQVRDVRDLTKLQTDFIHATDFEKSCRFAVGARCLVRALLCGRESRIQPSAHWV